MTIATMACLWVATAQVRADDVSRREVEKMIAHADDRCDEFRKIAAKHLATSILEGTRIESNINGAIEDLDKAIDRLKKRFDRDDRLKESRDEAQDVLRAAKDVDRALEDITRNSVIWEEWRPLLKRIAEIADAYELSKK